VLELSNETPVSRSQGPSVRIVNDMISGDGQEWLDREDEAFAKNHSLAVIDARDRRRFMESAPDAVSIEVLDNAKSVAACSLLDRPAKITESSAGLSGIHGVTLSVLRGLEQPGGHGGDLADGNADARVREVTVQLGRHVEVHEVAIAQLALERRDAMGRFIIDADARRARKSVRDPWCRASSVASEYLPAHCVELPGGRARSDGLHHGLAGLCDNTTGTKECIEIFLLVNRHARIVRRTVQKSAYALWGV
jgi:hypothetical protein